MVRSLRNLRRDGLAVLRGAIAASVCDQAVADYHAFVASSNEAEQWSDEHGLHSRLSNLHLSSEALCAIVTARPVMKVCDRFFAARTAVYSSLFFERGSQQAIHRDDPYFHTEPRGRFLGVWAALEDVNHDQGPLCYIPGGHRQEVPIPSADQYNPIDEYYAQLEGPTLVLTAHKGDVAVWHPFLPHGGTAIDRPGASRLSAVFHVVPEGTIVSGPSTWVGRDPVGNPSTWVERRGRLFAQAGAQFFPNT
jgi:phytanoyl-CoA hydroxylase